VGLFPLFVDLRERACVVLGGGAVAERKVESLLAVGALVTVVSPALTERLREHVVSGRIAHVARGYRAGDLAGAALAFAATDDGAINAAVACEGQARGIWVNAADDPAHCDFILPAVVRRGEVVVAVSTGGASPALARAVRERIESALPVGIAALAEIAGDTRRTLRARGRRTTVAGWLAGLDAALEVLVAGRPRAEAERTLREWLETEPCA
jgi:siroheme synthase-like protein